MALAPYWAGFEQKRVTLPCGEADGLLPIKNSGRRIMFTLCLQIIMFTAYQSSQVRCFGGQNYMIKLDKVVLKYV